MLTTVEKTTTRLDTRVRPHIRIVNGSLDEDSSSPHAIVLNGRIDPSTLRFLKVDESYQRPLGDRADIWDALKEGKVVPNIEIGIRGLDYEIDGSDVVIYSPAFIIDGWQRVGTALRLLDANPHHPIRMFGSFHFGTDDVWERHRFTELNKNVKKVSPNLHLRNMRDTNEAVLTLYGLSNNTKDFPLYKKVSWGQNMQRHELVSALVLCKTACMLHSQHTGLRGGGTEQWGLSAKTAAGAIGLQNFRRNIVTFVSLIDEWWPFAAIEYRKTATQLKASFLFELARLFSHHDVFWDASDRVLQVSADDRRKLSAFPINDPQVVNLAGSPGASRNILARLLIDHMNKGRSANRLRSRFER